MNAGDPDLLKRCRSAVAAHRRRARADGQAIDYRAEDLARIAAETPACCYCGDVLTPATLAFDHATPTARAASPATFALANLRACCAGCNLAKGVLLEEEWRRLLALLRTFTPRSGADVLLRLRHGGRRYAGSQ